MSVDASLRRRLADLHVERVATWRPEDLQVNIDQRALLEANADRSGFVAVGDKVPDFTLHEVDDAILTPDLLVQNGSAVLIFFRFAGCPACNIALPYYNETLAPTLKRLGIPPVAPRHPTGVRERELLDCPAIPMLDEMCALPSAL